MADFRKWLLAFAVVALLLGTGISAQAQSGLANGGSMQCTATSVPVLDRAEGFTELTGDIVLSCTGGQPTPAGQAIPNANFRVGLNTNITSRINPTDAVQSANSAAGGPPSEALLIIDNAFETPENPPAGHGPGQPAFRLCPSLTGCPAEGTGGATNPYQASDTGPDAPNGGYSAYEGVYIANPSATPGGGAISGFNAIDFLGVPIDAPGTTLSRVIRITNIRGDAVGRSGGAAGIVGSIPIIAYVSIGGALSNVTITNSQPTVAYIVPGIVITTTPASFTQCNLPSGGPSITIAEGFSYSFKPRIWTDSSLATSGIVDDTANENPELQNQPGFSYFSESGFTPNSFAAGSIGAADSGTRFIITYSNIQNGVSVSVPNIIQGTGSLILSLVPNTDAYGSGGTPTPVTLDGSGNPISAGNTTLVGSYAGGTTATTGFAVYEVIRATGTSNENFSVPFSVSFTPDVQANSPYVTPQGTTDLLTPNAGFSQATVWFAPSAPATVTNPSSGNAWNVPYGPGVSGEPYTWIPRFVNNSKLTNFIGILPCTCNLLFPYVTSATGYDTGIAIANTSMDPFGGFGAVPTTAPASGVCGDCVSPTGTSVTNNSGEVGGVVLWFFGNTTSTSATNPTLFSIPEATATTALIVPPGCTFAFEMTSPSQPPSQTLTGCGAAQSATGGLAANNYTINATSATTPLMGFTGYVIATASFQYCHGLAYILPTGTGAPLGGLYLAIELDTPFWATGIPGYTLPVTQRTGQYGESQAH